MGQPTSSDVEVFQSEYIGLKGKPRELKHLSNSWRRKNIDFLSSGERTGNSLNRVHVKAVSVVHTVSWDISGLVYRLVGKLQNNILAE